MASMLEHLDRDSMLLMYLADELPVSERDELQQRLAQDPELANQLNQLLALQTYCEQTLTCDESLPMSSDVAVRRVSRAMKQWQVDRLARKPSISPRRSHYRLPWWAYGTAVAAAVIVAALVWSSNLPDTSDSRPSPEQIAKTEDEVVDDIVKDWNDGVQQERESRNAMLGQQLLPEPISSDESMNEIFFRDSGERS